MRDVICDETMNSVGVDGRRITLQGRDRQSQGLQSRRVAAGRIRPRRARRPWWTAAASTADNVWFVWTGSSQAGPIVLLNCTFQGDGRVESHHALVHRHALRQLPRSPDGGIDFRNRGAMGSGHGWSMGWGVAWNCVAKELHHPEPAWLGQLDDRLHRQEQAQPAALRQRTAEFAGGDRRFARRSRDAAEPLPGAAGRAAGAAGAEEHWVLRGAKCRDQARSGNLTTLSYIGRP